MPTDKAGWWERERAELIRTRVRELTAVGDIIVDVGGGRGHMFGDPRLTGRTRICVDSYIWDDWEEVEGVLFVCADAGALPFRAGAFDLVGSFDVLEHLDDDTAALGEQRRVVRGDGHVVAAVPADPRLWSSHDVAVGHRRRYRRAGIIAAAATAQLACERCSYFFSYLWLPARLLRGSSARASEPGNRTSVVSHALSTVMGRFSRAERRVMRVWSIPFGTSLWSEFRPTTYHLSAALERFCSAHRGDGQRLATWDCKR